MRPAPHLHLHLPDFDVGGTEQWALAMAAVLADLPYRRSITAEARLDTAAATAFAAWDRVPIEAVPDHAYIVAPCDIARLVAQSRRVIAVAHGMNDYYKGLFALGGYYRAVAVSEVAKAAFPAGLEVAVLHNGVDLERLRPSRSRAEARRSLDIPQGAVVVGHVGRTAGGKNPLLAAMAAGAQDQGVALYVGPDPLPDVRRSAAALAECRFLTAGPAYPIADCYAAMDVCLVGSRTEGFSLVTAEAWASGVPIVSTPVGISLEHPELVVPVPHDPDGERLASAMSIALDPERRPDLERARALVRQRYSLEAMARRWRDFLAAVIG